MSSKAPLDEFESKELKAGFDLLAKDGRLTEDVVQRACRHLNLGFTQNEIHDIFVLFGGGKQGFTEKIWMDNFSHKDHGEADEEVLQSFNALADRGTLDFGKVGSLLRMNGRMLTNEVLETMQQVCDYDNDGVVSFDDYTTMLHGHNE
jgi:Ca2+-binding EF-hand superfamily protein